MVTEFLMVEAKHRIAVLCYCYMYSECLKVLG